MKKVGICPALCYITDIFSIFADVYYARKIILSMFRIPAITKNLLIINVLMFAATWVFARQAST